MSGVPSPLTLSRRFRCLPWRARLLLGWLVCAAALPPACALLASLDELAGAGPSALPAAGWWLVALFLAVVGLLAAVPPRSASARAWLEQLRSTAVVVRTHYDAEIRRLTQEVARVPRQP